MVVEKSEHFMMTQPKGIVNCNVISLVHLRCTHYNREILTRVVRNHLILLQEFLSSVSSFLRILFKILRAIWLHQGFGNYQHMHQKFPSQKEKRFV